MASAADQRMGPMAWWAVVTALVLVNQVAVVVYIERVWGGDPSRLQRLLPPGWFDLPEPTGPLRLLVDGFPAPELLAPSVLRVTAVLELPFLVLAYLAVAGWLGPAVAARLWRPPVLAALCAAATLAFCVIEALLPTPYTGQDIALRIATGALLPVLVHRYVRTPSEPRGAGGVDGDLPGASEIARFGVSAAAFGALILLVYDTALLYNLGRVGSRLPWALLAVAVLVLARRLPRTNTPSRPGPAVAVLGAGLGWFVVLFAVPSLPVRYGLTFGAPGVAALAGVAVLVASGLLAVRDVVRRYGHAPGRVVARWVAGAGIALGTGLVAGGAVALAGRDQWPYREVGLLVGALVALLVAAGTARAADALHRPRTRV